MPSPLPEGSKIQKKPEWNALQNSQSIMGLKGMMGGRWGIRSKHLQRSVVSIDSRALTIIIIIIINFFFLVWVFSLELVEFQFLVITVMYAMLRFFGEDKTNSDG
jgi:hypothetical protein